MGSSRLDSLLSMYSENQNDAFLTYALAKEYESSEDYQKAIEFYEKLDTIDPNYVGKYYHHGKLLWKLQKDEEALLVLDKGIAVAKEVGDGHALGELRQIRWEISDDEM